MVNGNIELWLQVVAIIVGLTGAVVAAFVGAYYGAKKSHDLEVQQRQEEEKEKVNDFEEATLRQLKWYASVLLKKENREDRDRLENLLISLRFGDASALYYKIPKEKREKIDSVLDLLFSEKYSEAIGELESLITQ